jgi:uncharacterized protein YgiB involved in biofilm formation
MRKSKAIRLVLLGSTSVALAACDESPPADARFFTSVEECSTVNPGATCQESFGKSREAYVAEAPRYNRREACEAEFGAGNCESREAGAGGMGSFFMPMMMGYMLGNAFNRPVYRGPDNSAVMRTGGKFYNVGNFAGTGRSAAFRPAQTAQAMRGGFGGTAASHRTSSGG